MAHLESISRRVRSLSTGTTRAGGAAATSVIARASGTSALRLAQVETYFVTNLGAGPARGRTNYSPNSLLSRSRLSHFPALALSLSPSSSIPLCRVPARQSRLSYSAEGWGENLLRESVKPEFRLFFFVHLPPGSSILGHFGGACVSILWACFLGVLHMMYD